jgi:hypothetical protein
MRKLKKCVCYTSRIMYIHVQDENSTFFTHGEQEPNVKRSTPNENAWTKTHNKLN